MINPLNARRSGSKRFVESDLIQIRHDLMCVYGWIPKDEFIKITIPELFDLHELAVKELERSYKKYRAIMTLAGVKNDL